MSPNNLGQISPLPITKNTLHSKSEPSTRSHYDSNLSKMSFALRRVKNPSLGIKLLVFTTFLTTIFFAQASLAQNRLSWICTLKHDAFQRRVELHYLSQNKVPCQAFDRKKNGSQRIAKYQNTPNRCERHVEDLLRVLRDGGYTCLAPREYFVLKARDLAVVDSIKQRPATISEDSAFFAVVAEFDSSTKAQAELSRLRRSQPYLKARVFPPKLGSTKWSIVLAAYTNFDDAARAVQVARKTRVGKKAFLWSFDGPYQNTAAWAPAPDEWRQLLLRQCYDEGARDTQAIAACSGLRANSEEVVHCITGGPCVLSEILPQNIPNVPIHNIPENLNEIRDLLIYVEPMIGLQKSAERCMEISRESNNPHRLFGECMAGEMMSNDQKFVYGCYSESDKATEIALCISGRDNFTPKEMAAAECLLEAASDRQRSVCISSGFLEGKEAAIANCAIESEDEEDLLSCAAVGQLPPEIEPYATCISDHYQDETEDILACSLVHFLNEEQQEFAQCALTSENIFSYAVCMSRDELTPEQEIVATCAAESADPYQFVACAGGKLTAREISKCFSGGIGTKDGCFGPNNFIVSGIDDIVADLQRGGLGDNNEVIVALKTISNDMANGIGDSNDIKKTLKNAANDVTKGPGKNNEVIRTFDRIVPKIGF